MANRLHQEAIAIFSSVFNLSGVETALMRILRWLRSQKLHGILVLPEGVEIDSSWQADFTDGTLTVVRSTISISAKGSRFTEVCKVLGRFERVHALSICLKSFHDSLIVESLIGSNIMRSFFYYLSGESGREDQQKGLISEILRQPGDALMRKLVGNRRIIFMDEYTRTMCIRDYRLKIPPSKMLLLRLPMEVPEFKPDCDRVRFDHTPRQILAITRMDFPMKGYVFGLIDSFSKLCQIHDDIQLILVGNGVNADRLEKKLSTVPTDISCKIHWHPKVPYDELERFFKTSYVFVGMGTTVIDAASRGIPTIPVYPLQEGDACLDFFHLLPILSGHLTDTEKTLKLSEQLNIALRMNKDEYECISRSSNAESQRHYGIKSFMDTFRTFQPKQSIMLRILCKFWALRNAMR